MTYTEFMALEESERQTVFNSEFVSAADYDSLTAERDSYRNENESLKNTVASQREELRRTKEMNFTLSRKLDTGSGSKSAEEIMNELFK